MSIAGAKPTTPNGENCSTKTILRAQRRSQVAPLTLNYPNAASRERFPLGVPHESHRYMQAENFG